MAGPYLDNESSMIGTIFSPVIDVPQVRSDIERRLF
jgi:hypothetical protein